MKSLDYKILILLILCIAISYGRFHDRYDKDNDLSLWINEQQVKLLSGFSLKVYAIDNGRVSPHVKDPNFSTHLPLIPSELEYVNFTWKSGTKKYRYNFDRLISLDEKVLQPPKVSIKTEGRIPRKAKEFSIIIPCVINSTGIGMLSIGLSIENANGHPIPGTPLRITLRKECLQRGIHGINASAVPDLECNKSCLNNGWCNHEKTCQCPEGYMGQFCQTALCYPKCENGGNCTAPAICSCPKGYQGRHCEGGICSEKCLNGGKCIQKDKCECPKGYYGLRCEYSKCVIPCQNGGKCRGVNKCRCPPGLQGDHCEIGRRQRSVCGRSCKHGICTTNGYCECFENFIGKYCNRRVGEKRKQHKKIPT